MAFSRTLALLLVAGVASADPSPCPALGSLLLSPQVSVAAVTDGRTVAALVAIDGRAADAVRVRALGGGIEVAAATTDVRGLAILRDAWEADELVLEGPASARVALVHEEHAWFENDTSTLRERQRRGLAIVQAQPDRGVHLPGSRARLLVAGWRYTPTGSAPMRHERLAWTVDELSGVAGGVILDDDGLADLAFVVPAGARARTYQVRFEGAGEIVSAGFVRVGEPAPDPLRATLSVQGGRSPVYVGDTLPLTLHLEYPTWAPVSASVVVGGTPVPVRGPDGFLFGAGDPTAPSGMQETGPTRLQRGRADLSLRLLPSQFPGGEWDLDVFAWLTGPGVGPGSRAVLSQRLVVRRAEVIAGVRWPLAAVNEGDTLRPEVLVIDHEGRPVAGRPIRVELVSREVGSRSPLSTHCALVSMLGPSTCEVVASEPGRHLLRVVATDEAGRESESGVVVEVFGAAAREPLPSGVRLGLDRRGYAPGERARVFVEGHRDAPHALVVVAARRILDVKRIALHDGSGAADLIVPQDAPAFVRVVVPRVGGDVQEGTVELPLSVPRELRVEFIRGPVALAPGSEGTWRIRTTDAAGNPVRARLAVAGVSEAEVIAPAFVLDFAPWPRAARFPWVFTPNAEVAAMTSCDFESPGRHRGGDPFIPDARTGEDGLGDIVLRAPLGAGALTLVAVAFAGETLGRASTVVDVRESDL